MVNVEEIKSAIIDREEEIRQKFEKEKIIDREVGDRTKGIVSTDVALVITGVRRCGKSILAFMLGKDGRYGYVNFEDERLSIEAKDLNLVLEAIYSLKGDVDFLIFDEIQNVPGWERFVARLIQNKKIIVTGSNARLLGRELSTYLTGRHVDFALFPFSFREFLAFRGFEPNVYLTKDIARTKNHLEEYLEKGGFPLTHRIGKLFLVENFKDIVERDVVQRYGIRYVKVLKDLAKYLVSNTSNEVSYNKLKDIFGVKSVHTITNYASYLQDAYLVFTIERFSFKLKQQMLAPKKVYCVDTGLANAIGFRTSKRYGGLIENSVAVELFRNRDIELYYWKDHQQREVDFVLKQGAKVEQLIQVCYDPEDFNTKERELKALVKASKELMCDNLLVITWDYEGEEEFSWFGTARKIEFVPLWKWLLEE